MFKLGDKVKIHDQHGFKTTGTVDIQFDETYYWVKYDDGTLAMSDKKYLYHDYTKKSSSCECGAVKTYETRPNETILHAYWCKLGS